MSGEPKLKQATPSDLKGVVDFRSSLTPAYKTRKLALEFLRHILSYDSELTPENMFKVLPSLAASGTSPAGGSFLTQLPSIQRSEITQILTKISGQKGMLENIYTVFPTALGPSLATGSELSTTFTNSCLGTAMNTPQVRPFFRSPAGLLYFQRICDGVAPNYPIHSISDSSNRLYNLLRLLPPNLVGKQVLICNPDLRSIIWNEQRRFVNSLHSEELVEKDKLDRLSLYEYYVDSTAITGALNNEELEKYKHQVGVVKDSEQATIWQFYDNQISFTYSEYLKLLLNLASQLLKGRLSGTTTGRIGNADDENDVAEEISRYIRKSGCLPGSIASMEAWALSRLKGFGAPGEEYLDRVYDVLGLAGAHGLYVFDDSLPLDDLKQREINGSTDLDGDLAKNCYSNIGRTIFIYGSRARDPAELVEWSKKTSIIDHRLQVLLSILRGSLFRAKGEDWSRIIDKTPVEILSFLSPSLFIKKKSLTTSKGTIRSTTYICRKCGYNWTDISTLKAGSTPETLPCPKCGTKAYQTSSKSLTSPPLPSSEKGNPFVWVTEKEMKPNLYKGFQFRYLTNFIGGRLHHLRKYFLGEGDLGELGPMTHPLDLWCLLLEIQYLLGFFTTHTGTMDKREMWGIISSITTAISGWDDVEKIKHEVETRLNAPEWEEESRRVNALIGRKENRQNLIASMRYCIANDEWERFVGSLTKYFRNKKRKQFELEEEKEGEEEEEEEGEEEEEEEKEKKTRGRKSFYTELIKEPSINDILLSRFPIMVKVAHFLRTHLIPVPPHIPDFVLPSETLTREGRRVPSDEGFSRYLRIYSGLRSGRSSGGKFRVRPKLSSEICRELESAIFFSKPYMGFVKGGTPGSQKETVVQAMVYACGKMHLTTRYTTGKKSAMRPIKCPTCGASARVLRTDQNTPSPIIIKIDKTSEDYLEVHNDDKEKTVRFAGNRWIYYAAQGVADRRIRNYVYNCGVEAATGNNTTLRGLHERKGKTINLLKQTWLDREAKVNDQRDLNLKIDNAIMEQLKTSFADFIYWARTKSLSDVLLDGIFPQFPRVKRFSITRRTSSLRNRFDHEKYWDKYLLGKSYNLLWLREYMKKIRNSVKSFTGISGEVLSDAWNFAWWNDALLCLSDSLLQKFTGIAYGLMNLVDSSGEPDGKRGIEIVNQLGSSLASDTISAIKDTVGKYTSLAQWYSREKPKEGGAVGLLDSLCKAFALYFEGKARVLEREESPDEDVVADLKLKCVKYLKLIYALEYLTDSELAGFSFFGLPDTMGGFSFLLGQPGFLPSSGLNKIIGILLANTVNHENVWEYIKGSYLDAEKTRGYENFNYRHTGYDDIAGDLTCSLAILLSFRKDPDSEDVAKFNATIAKAWQFRVEGIPEGTPPEEIVDPTEIFQTLFTSFKDDIDVPDLLPREVLKLGAITSSPSSPALGKVDFSRGILSQIVSGATRSIPFIINVPPLLNHLGFVWNTEGKRVEAVKNLLITSYDDLFKPGRNPLKPEVLFRHPGPVLHTQALESEVKAQRQKYANSLRKIKKDIDTKTKIIEKIRLEMNEVEPYSQHITSLRKNLRLINGFARSQKNSQRFLETVKSGLQIPEFFDQLRCWAKLNSKTGIYQFGFSENEQLALRQLFGSLAGLDNPLNAILSLLKGVYESLIRGELDLSKGARESITGVSTPIDFEEWGLSFIAQCTGRISCAQGDLFTNYRKLHFVERELNRLSKLLLSKGWAEKTARGPRGAIRRKKFQAAIEYLLDENNCPLFHEYIYGCNMTTEIRVDTNVIGKINGGALISSIQFLPHNKGKRHVIANVALRGAPFVKLKFTAKISPPIGSVLFEDSTLGIDVNRIGCLRPLAFSIIHQKDDQHRPVLFPLETGSLATDDLAMLAQVYCFSGAGGPHSYNGRIKGNPIGTQPVEVALAFLEKVSDSILRSGGKPPVDSYFEVIKSESKLYLPTIKHPFSFFPENAEASSSTYNDQLWAIPFYWTRLSDHIRDHGTSCLKRLGVVIDNCLKGMAGAEVINDKEREDLLRKGVSDEVLAKVKRYLSLKGKKEGKKKKTGWDLKLNRILRLERQIKYLENRMLYLHKSAIMYLFYATLFMVLKRPVARVSYENVRFSMRGLRGPVAMAVQGMLKDFNDIRLWVIRQLKEVKKQPPDFVQVRAAGTSQYCHSHRTGTIDNSLSPDYCPCSENGEIVDRHVNAASNIAYRYYLDRKLGELEKRYGSIVSQFNIENLRLWQEKEIGSPE